MTPVTHTAYLFNLLPDFSITVTVRPTTPPTVPLAPFFVPFLPAFLKLHFRSVGHHQATASIKKGKELPFLCRVFLRFSKLLLPKAPGVRDAISLLLILVVVFSLFFFPLPTKNFSCLILFVEDNLPILH